jgi:uncharacterized protein YdcH (DUF465 family)
MADDHVIDRFHDRRETIGDLRTRDANFRDLCDDFNKVIDMLDESTSRSERNRRDLVDLRDALEAEIKDYLQSAVSTGRQRVRTQEKGK